MTSIEEMLTLEQKYKLNGTVGDQVKVQYSRTTIIAFYFIQDWLTLVSWEYPHQDLIYTLPCQFNRQTDKIYDNERYKDTFSIYHKCDETPMIIHNNGE